MADPIVFTSGIITAAGVVLLMMGAFTIFKYFRMDPLDAQKEQGLAKGICAVLMGLFCVFQREWIITTFPLLTVVYGVVILLTGIMRIQWAAYEKRTVVYGWGWGSSFSCTCNNYIVKTF